MLTHKQHIERDKGRYEGATCQTDTHILTGGKKRGRPFLGNHPVQHGQNIRQGHPYHHFNGTCSFSVSLQNKTKKQGQSTSSACRSTDIGKSVEQIVQASNNNLWKLNLADIPADKDFLARDITYHKLLHHQLESICAIPAAQRLHK